MKPNIVPNCIRTENYVITFEVEEEKYISPQCLNCMLLILCLYLQFNNLLLFIWICLTFPGFRYLERNTSWNSLMMSLLKPIAWFIFQVSSGFLLTYISRLMTWELCWFVPMHCNNSTLWCYPANLIYNWNSLILFRFHSEIPNMLKLTLFYIIWKVKFKLPKE